MRRATYGRNAAPEERVPSTSWARWWIPSRSTPFSPVVDGGRARVPRFSPRTGMTRLETVRVSLAPAEQRRGRAGRQGPGICYRLWSPAEETTFLPAPAPEILEADLTPLVLALASAGVVEPVDLAWLDPPPRGAVAEPRALLVELGPQPRPPHHATRPKTVALRASSTAGPHGGSGWATVRSPTWQCATPERLGACGLGRSHPGSAHLGAKSRPGRMGANPCASSPRLAHQG